LAEKKRILMTRKLLILLGRGAQGIAAEIPQGLRSKHEELERKARFFAKQKMRTFVLGKVL
jgi:hypothetical protein